MEEESGQNRLFVILAVSLIGLLVLGLLGVGGVFIIRQNLEEQAIASQPTPTLMAILPNPTATLLPTTPTPTNTPSSNKWTQFGPLPQQANNGQYPHAHPDQYPGPGSSE